MAEKKGFYLTTTLPYVNADPHIGFALELVQADVLARYHAHIGEDIFFNTGADEHGIKIYRKALEAGVEPQSYVDMAVQAFQQLGTALNVYQPLHFIRTTDPKHIKAAQAFWQRCYEQGDIYLKNYQIKYCIGCELEKTDSELIDGHCILHPNLEIELIAEENYFFRFSKFQQKLLDLYDAHPLFVVPKSRFNEIQKFVQRGLQDFSISRRKDKMPWGIPVPGDDTQVMYVWFDALVSYISTLGWPDDAAQFKFFWGTPESPNAIQLAGKDNLRQQSAMWQAMLMSAGLPSSKQIVIHGFITSDGQKMSKSLGNVIDPNILIQEFGVDAVRYYLAGHVAPFEDSDITIEGFKEVYNGYLANGLGNLSARVMTLAQTYLEAPVIPDVSKFPSTDVWELLTQCEFNCSLGKIWDIIKEVDEEITDTRPFKVVKENPEEGKELITGLVMQLAWIATLIDPFMPQTSEAILQAIAENKKPGTLFPRKD